MEACCRTACFLSLSLYACRAVKHAKNEVLAAQQHGPGRDKTIEWCTQMSRICILAHPPAQTCCKPAVHSSVYGSPLQACGLCNPTKGLRLMLRGFITERRPVSPGCFPGAPIVQKSMQGDLLARCTHSCTHPCAPRMLMQGPFVQMGSSGTHRPIKLSTTLPFTQLDLHGYEAPLRPHSMAAPTKQVPA